jgi:hypothetical protein
MDGLQESEIAPYKSVVYEPQHDQPIRSEEDLFGGLVRPRGRTSYDEVFEWDELEQRIKKKAKDLGTPEINLPDLTTAILTNGRATYSFTWHTIAMINQLVYIQQATGYDLRQVIRFFYNNLTTNLNLSKSSEGALLKAITTKEMRQITEQRNYTQPSDEGPDAISGWWNRKKNQAAKQGSSGFQ